MSQGPGWWIASDGKWYPPESHPDRSASTDAVSEEPAPAAVRPASRWLGRNDPSPSPSPSPSELVASLNEQLGDPSAAAPGAGWPTAATAVPTEAPLPTHLAAATTTSAGGFSLRQWVVAGAALVGLALAAVLVALVSGSTSGAGLLRGQTSATITIVSPPSGQPSFSGTVDGEALTGTVAGSVTSSPLNGAAASGSGTSSAGAVSFTYAGSLGGRSFVLHVSLDEPGASAALENGGLTFAVSGTYGSEPIAGTAAFGVSSPLTSQSLTVPFSGTVGTQRLTGVATASQPGGGSITVHATLTVT